MLLSGSLHLCWGSNLIFYGQTHFFFWSLSLHRFYVNGGLQFGFPKYFLTFGRGRSRPQRVPRRYENRQSGKGEGRPSSGKGRHQVARPGVEQRPSGKCPRGPGRTNVGMCRRENCV